MELDVAGEYRDRLGRRVRELWIQWAKEQVSPKPSWLVPYDELSEADKEADRCIGSGLVNDFVSSFACYRGTAEAVAKYANLLADKLHGYAELYDDNDARQVISNFHIFVNSHAGKHPFVAGEFPDEKPTITARRES